MDESKHFQITNKYIISYKGSTRKKHEQYNTNTRSGTTTFKTNM